MPRTANEKHEPNRSALAGLARGLLRPGRAAQLLLAEPGLKRYLVMPLIVTGAVYLFVWSILLYLLWHWDIPDFGPWEFAGWLGPLASRVLNQAAEVSKWLVGIPLVLIISYFTFTTVGMIVASPFNDMLSERVERAIRRSTSAESTTGTLQATIRSIAHSAWLGGAQAVAVVATLPLLLVPLVGIVPLFVVTAYFTGIGFLDVPAARHGLRHGDRRALVAGRRAELLGLGIAMQLLFWIPFLGLLLLPVGVVAGTLMYCDDP